ncbi:lysophosphatidic acid receptor 2a [Chanos chanos]|uniref:Lysophosphatidic acid receptor 2a n=1 Tax=Chanos chanos TaxID=29144 RepID=A0A6J2WPL8_CHACN|nr:lysophosphatidic acid receptor 2-like [Chanos chanos]
MPAEDCLKYGFDDPVKFFYNRSGKFISSEWEKRDYVVVALGLPVCVIVILANLMVITAFIINRRFHFPIYYLLGNMAAADLFAGISYLNLMFHTGPWTINLTVRQWFIRGALIDMSLCASVTNLLAVAIERHQTIFGMQLHSKMSNRRVFILITGIWMLALVMGLMPIMGWNCMCGLATCSVVSPLYSRSYHVFLAILTLVIFSIMVAMYTRIFIYVRHKSSSMSQNTSQVQHKETVVNLMKTVAIVLGAFVICWTPGMVILLLDGLDCKTCQVLQFEKYCLVLAECNSLVNPIIYSYRDVEMRSTFKHILCYPWRRGRYQQGEPSGAYFDTIKSEVLFEKPTVCDDSRTY